MRLAHYPPPHPFQEAKKRGEMKRQAHQEAVGPPEDDSAVENKGGGKKQEGEGKKQEGEGRKQEGEGKKQEIQEYTGGEEGGEYERCMAKNGVSLTGANYRLVYKPDRPQVCV